ncbi:methyltransferase domain-containing protein [Thiohalobacter sp. IOR34]|uniref:class I SAM-dependent methyltransferase n=1 Tax=Thiohalobacter sp. IOR34 TaxID=3057176 RepID=UPI0025AF94FC|nr:methyltransferase domain-containing protein [Thiohalobacter sp. IOR34]WJW75295.1 methyltransferase domain-containing protein [Thiohalobacter sp. IOR34]
MNVVHRLARRLSSRAREKRGQIFRQSFELGPDTKIIDLGCGDGSNLAKILEDTAIRPENVYVADIGSHVVRVAGRYGFNPVRLSESGKVPFGDSFFDIVFCSSVIEHVTLPKSEVWGLYNGREFRERARSRQVEFAAEIRRIGRQYFVQTPNKWFLVESHTWLPFLGWLPRRLLLPLLKISNRIWVKQSAPDWRLLTKKDMRELFPEAKLVAERTPIGDKSIMAVKSDDHSKILPAD